MKNKRGILLIGLFAVLLANQWISVNGEPILTEIRLGDEDWTQLTGVDTSISSIDARGGAVENDGTTYFAFKSEEGETRWCYVVKFDPAGDQLWMHKMARANFTAADLFLDPTGESLYLVGNDINSTSEDTAYLMKLDPGSGEEQREMVLKYDTYAYHIFDCFHPSTPSRLFIAYKWSPGSPVRYSNVVEIDLLTWEITWEYELEDSTGNYYPEVTGIGYSEISDLLYVSFNAKEASGYTSANYKGYVQRFDAEGAYSGAWFLGIDEVSVTDIKIIGMKVVGSKIYTLVADGQLTPATEDIFIQERSLTYTIEKEYRIYTRRDVLASNIIYYGTAFSTDGSRVVIAASLPYYPMETTETSHKKRVILTYDFDSEIDNYSLISSHHFGYSDEARTISIYGIDANANCTVLTVAGVIETEESVYSGFMTKYSLSENPYLDEGLGNDYEGLEMLYGPFLENRNWVALGTTAGVFVILGVLLGQIGKKKAK